VNFMLIRSPRPAEMTNTKPAELPGAQEPANPAEGSFGNLSSFVQRSLFCLPEIRQSGVRQTVLLHLGARPYQTKV
jgi:hypothetical protein